MSTAQFTCPLIVTIPGQIIASSLWNNEFVNLFTNLNPSGIGAYSDNDFQMQTSTDPYPSGTSRPTSLSGEIERLRYIIALCTGNTYWYQHPAVDIATFKSRFDSHKHDGTTNNGVQLDETSLKESVAGDGLIGGNGTPLAVNVDNVTLEINLDKVRFKNNEVLSSIVKGTTTNDDAPSGFIGEYFESFNSRQNQTSAQAVDLTSIDLGAGDWDIEIHAVFDSLSGSMTAAAMAISTTPGNTFAGTTEGRDYVGTQQMAGFGTSGQTSLAIPRKRVKLTATTTYYLKTQINYSGTCQISGLISARRRR